jgi:hypothetical protein
MSNYWEVKGIAIVPLKSEDEYDLDEYKQLRKSGVTYHFVVGWTPSRLLHQLIEPSECIDCERLSTFEIRDIPKRLVLKLGKIRVVCDRGKLSMLSNKVSFEMCGECFMVGKLTTRRCSIHGTKKRKRDVVADTHFFADKLKKFLDGGGILDLKENCKYENGQMWMMCVSCEIFQPRTTAFFTARQGGRGFADSPPGHESLNNSCKKCSGALDRKRQATKSGFVKNLVGHYPKLTVDWFYATLEKQHGKGPITSAPITLTTNGAGIHRKDNTKEHTPGNCFIEVQELNVAQYDAIPDLKEAWTEVFQHLVSVFGEDDVTDYFKLFLQNSGATPKSLGINYHSETYLKEIRDQRFEPTLRNAIHAHIKTDVKRRDFQLPANTSKKQFVDMVFPNAIAQLKKQRGRCGYTDIGLTIANRWTRFSLERINNDLAHFTADGKLSNCMFICRLFNAPKQLSTRLILEYFLTQILVDVPDSTRIKVRDILDGK